MKNTALGLLTILLLGGCAESGKDVKPVEAAVAAESPAPQSATSFLNAERLLASTLESAKAQDKRVMVHLGAPW
jgi:hypothetical protein